MKTPVKELIAAHARYHYNKLCLFGERCRTNEWPADTCKHCKQRQACCCDYLHHVGDICTHCGNNELNETKWLYREME